MAFSHEIWLCQTKNLFCKWFPKTYSIHSIKPDFSIKKDVVPNRYTVQWFETTDLCARKMSLFYSRLHSSDAEPSPSGSKALITSKGLDVKNAVAGQCAKDKKDNPELDCQDKAENVKIGLHQIFCTEYCGDHHLVCWQKLWFLNRVILPCG